MSFLVTAAFITKVQEELFVIISDHLKGDPLLSDMKTETFMFWTGLILTIVPVVNTYYAAKIIEAHITKS